MENENSTIANFENFSVEPIHEKYAWRICDLMTVNSERFRRFFPKTLEQNLTPTLSQIFVEQKLREFQNKEELLFVLKEKESRTLVGLVYIKKLDWGKKEAELAYCIGYQFEGKGWMTQSIKKITEYAFKELQLETLQIIVHKSNLGSIRVAEKCGFIWTKKLLQEHTPPNENPLDMELYELQSPN